MFTEDVMKKFEEELFKKVKLMVKTILQEEEKSRKSNEVVGELTDEWLNKKQACKYMNISNGTLNKYIDMGLEVTQIDSVIRISKKDIHTFLESFK